MMMSSTAASVSRPSSSPAAGEVSLLRIYLLRAAYLLIVVGLGFTILPALLRHEPMARGVIPSLLGGVWLLAIFGVRHPLQMLPVLLFEFAWKSIWFVGYGLPQWSSGQVPPTFAEDFTAIAFGVILMPIIIPWGYVYRHYLKANDRWTMK